MRDPHGKIASLLSSLPLLSVHINIWSSDEDIGTVVKPSTDHSLWLFLLTAKDVWHRKSGREAEYLGDAHPQLRVRWAAVKNQLSIFRISLQSSPTLHSVALIVHHPFLTISYLLSSSALRFCCFHEDGGFGNAIMQIAEGEKDAVCSSRPMAGFILTVYMQRVRQRQHKSI